MKRILTAAVLGMTANLSVADDAAFAMQVMDAFVIVDSGTVMTGRVSTGVITAGDVVCVPLKSGGEAARKVEEIQLFRRVLERAEAGQHVGLLVSGIGKDDIHIGGTVTSGCTLDEDD